MEGEGDVTAMHSSASVMGRCFFSSIMVIGSNWCHAALGSGNLQICLLRPPGPNPVKSPVSKRHVRFAT